MRAKGNAGAGASRDRVLAADQLGRDEGQWQYYADPLTQRDGSGQNRVGAYRLLNKTELDALNNPPPGSDEPARSGYFLGLQSGFETWYPEPTSIAAVTTVEDQLGYAGGVAKFMAQFPDGLNLSNNAVKTAWHNDDQRHRVLFVCRPVFADRPGKSLSEIKAGDGTDGAGEGNSDGRGISEPRIIATTQDQTISAENQKLFDKGWDQLVAELNAKGQKVMREDMARGMDAALIRVTLKD